jgi:hypothetical protein
MAKLIGLRLVSLALLVTTLAGCGEKIDPNDPSLKQNIRSTPGMPGPGGAAKKGPGAGKAD